MASRGREAGALVTENRGEAELVASYHALLNSDPAIAEASDQQLRAAQQAMGLTMPGRLLCSVLRPRFLTERRKVELDRISTILAAVFERAGAVLLASDRLLDLVGATESEREIWQVDPGFPGFTVTSRLDSFMIESVPRFVEYNAESPASIGYCDVLSEIFFGLPSMQRWSERHRLQRFHARRELTDTLLWAYRSWGGTGTPSLAIIDWDNVMTRRDFELCAEYFRDHGIPTVITDPRRFEYRGGHLSLNGEKIDLLYRRVLLHELLDKAGEASALLDAYRDGAVCIVNSPRSKLLHKKAVFALLEEGTLGLDLSSEEVAVIDATIPWTRLVKSGETTYRGGLVELERFVLDHREELALKPIDDYGGRGVYLGWEMSPDEWERAIERALQEEYVVQERVPVPRASFPVWEGGRTESVSLLVDTDPLLFRGQVGGTLTRISGSALLNVSAGTGSTAPTFVVSGEEE